MSDNDWAENFEEDLTPDSEEALRQEIEKSKSLKVERLALRDEIEKLQAQNSLLAEKINELEDRIQSLPASHPSESPQSHPLENTSEDSLTVLPAQWPFFLLAFNLVAIALLIFLILNK